MRMREKRVEREFTRRVSGLGGWAIKLLPSVAGLPDRMAILPGGRVIFVELKAPRGTVAVHQHVVHRRLAELGCHVEVLSTLDEVQRWADRQTSGPNG